ncbi:hypothetical protein [Serratia odorifera]|uniref:hypothetical protein n=1 Tax=Serratia odorifera TaxID=618 RepID=UPI0018E7FF6A|nr:hypothetical protein [Serratia odorifera]MBJ2065131.1 hypothetical protein [Serratia odorifera]
MRLTGYFISNINQRMAIYSAENVAMVGEEFRRLGVLTAVIASFQTTVSDQNRAMPPRYRNERQNVDTQVWCHR